MMPGLGLASAFALGAIVSPTDAVAATAVGRRLGLPSRLLTILEGEGLVNDASALVSAQFRDRRDDALGGTSAAWQ